ncbi:hypothetical protein [Limihaloglobus sulfuriphilus]|uniref:hypothetical protein n=1 Tax=Limihaloglobus sulfuriphilus TaxID=1851148 RepID=UPI0011BA82D6|nr:hypothetical protein [Limihaloglobus sulfuriphilus]
MRRIRNIQKTYPQPPVADWRLNFSCIVAMVSQNHRHFPQLNAADLQRDLGYKPATPIQTGVNCFVEWYRDFYRI